MRRRRGDRGFLWRACGAAGAGLWMGGCVGMGSGSPDASLAEAGLSDGGVRDNSDLVRRDHAWGARRVSALWSGTPGAARIIYVHGTPGDATNFAAFLIDPVAGHESVSVDRPGFGVTGGPPAVSFEDQAAALEPLLVAAPGPDGAERWPVLVGHSLGGPIVARAAADFPDRVGAAVILAGSLDPDLEEPRWYNHAAGAPVVRWMLPRTVRVSNEEIFAAVDQTRRLDGVIDRVRCPVVVLHGERDGLVPAANVEYMTRRFTGAWAVEAWVLPDAGHMLPWTRKAEVRRAVERAIELAGVAASDDGTAP